MHNEQLDLVFSALSDATRRGMLATLSEGEQNITALAAPYAMSQPAISKHLRVLESAGLIFRERRGRDHFIRANPAPAEEAADWIAYYTAFWRNHFDAVGAYLKTSRTKKK
jgi:DNA-binding transcriptional ArsR family regulator